MPCALLRNCWSKKISWLAPRQPLVPHGREPALRERSDSKGRPRLHRRLNRQPSPITNGLARTPRHRVPRQNKVQSQTPPMQDVRRGLIIVNTGPGKGKTTAAMGTALRAVGQGMRVLMLQFLKGSWHYGELDAVKVFGDKFVMKQMGRGFVKVGAEKPDAEDVRLVEQAWAEAEKAISSGEWDLVVLDEINYAISYGMLDQARVVECLKKKPEMVHVILTGRNAHPTIVEVADTVTEMRQVKHAYEKGVMAQRGIEY